MKKVSKEFCYQQALAVPRFIVVMLKLYDHLVKAVLQDAAKHPVLQRLAVGPTLEHLLLLLQIMELDNLLQVIVMKQ